MLKKILLPAVLIVTVAASVSLAASPVPPEKGQWTLALESTLPLHRKANIDSILQTLICPISGSKFPAQSVMMIITSDDPKTCREFLGADLIGKSQPQRGRTGESF